MKTVSIYLILLLTAFDIHAQIFIATSNYANATANHNQRKVIRDWADNVYVVFVDSTVQGKIIKGLKLDHKTGQWTNATAIVTGNNPTLSLSSKGEIHLVFESNDPIVKIKHIHTSDFSNWSPEKIISDSIFRCKLPVSDIDLHGNLNLFWIQENDSLNSSLMYARVNEDAVAFKKTVTTKNKITDIAIANHLQYYSDAFIFSIQFADDSLQFFRTNDYMESFDTIYTAIGSQPCASYNSNNGGDDVFENSRIRLLYIDPSSKLIEVESSSSGYYKSDNVINVNQLSASPTDYICIDDVLPNIGYSFLFTQNGNLYHCFSYGAENGWTTMLDTISGPVILPSLAYKTFSYDHIDFIWMKKNGASYDIFYKRDEKFKYVGVEDSEIGKGFSMVGYPNPFTNHLTIHVTANDLKEKPIIEIFNTNSQLIMALNPDHSSGNQFSFSWYGKNKENEEIIPGVYFVKCSLGDKIIVRKVFYMK